MFHLLPQFVEIANTAFWIIMMHALWVMIIYLCLRFKITRQIIITKFYIRDYMKMKVWITHIMGKLSQKNEETSGGKAHTNTRKLNWDILMIKDVFLNQKTPSLPCSHTYSLLINKDICDHQNISSFRVCLSSGDLFFFSVRLFPSFV
jgi:hypothetical protein